MTNPNYNNDGDGMDSLVSVITKSASEIGWMRHFTALACVASKRGDKLTAAMMYAASGSLYPETDSPGPSEQTWQEFCSEMNAAVEMVGWRGMVEAARDAAEAMGARDESLILQTYLFMHVQLENFVDDVELAEVEENQLAEWVELQKLAYRAGLLSSEEISKLEGIPGWNWND